jgi:ABC-type lipoprotein export system ATPase subunit
VLDDVSVEIWPGTLTVIAGPSGSGKTTLISILGGHIAPDRGRVHAVDPCGEQHNVVQFCAWAPQGANCLPARSASDNVAIGALGVGIARGTADEIAANLLDAVGLSWAANSLARTLSGGELTRLAVARALATQRPIVLLDEPTGPLDHRTTVGIVQMLTSVVERGTSVVAASHDPALALCANQLIEISDGVVNSHR